MLAHSVSHGRTGATSQVSHHRGANPQHVVTFYENDAFLTAAVRGFLLDGLLAGETVVVVATPAHRQDFAAALGDAGHDISASRRDGRYVELDAASTLARLVPDGELTTARFEEQIARFMTSTAAISPGLRCYGEMTSLLWERGELTTALELEDRWNALLRRVRIPLFCGHPLSGFDSPETTARFHDMCARHSVVTTDSYGTLSVAGSSDDPIVMLDARQPGGARS